MNESQVLEWIHSMESRSIKVKCAKNSKMSIDIIPGHFATSHSHVNYYVDMTKIKHRIAMAQEAAATLASEYAGTPVDTIVCMKLSDEGVTIFFSTHITSDLDKCADRIVYIRSGEILAQNELSSFAAGYRIYELTSDQLTTAVREKSLGAARTKTGISVLTKADEPLGVTAPEHEPTLEEIMIHLEKTTLPEESAGQEQEFCRTC